MTQTRSHILADCTDHEEHRGILAAASQDLSIQAILSTYKGLTALARFIDASNAFRKPFLLCPMLFSFLCFITIIPTLT